LSRVIVMKKILPLAAAAAMLAAGCGGQPSAASPAWVTVNGHAISQAAVMTRVGVIQVLDPQEASTMRTRSNYVSEANELAAEYLLAQQAQKAKFTVTKSAISTSESQIDSFLSSSYGSKSAVTKALKKYGVTQQDIDAYAKDAALFQAYLAKVAPAAKVTDAEIKSFYQANLSQFEQPKEYDLAHILVKTQAQAASILQQLQAGADFATLAKKYSTDTASAKQGGDLGYAPLSNYVTAFANAAAKLTKVGQLSPVVHSQYGYHIIKLLGVKPASTQPLTAVQSEIKSYLEQQNTSTAYETYVTNLTKKAKIKVSVPQKVS